MKTLLKWLVGIAVGAPVVGMATGVVRPSRATPLFYWTGRTILALWNIANHHVQQFVRWMFTGGVQIAVGGPILLLVLALCSVPGPVIALVTLLLFVVIPFRFLRRVACGFRDPLVVLLIGEVRYGKVVLWWLGAIFAVMIGVGLVVGTFLTFVPVTTDRMLIPGLILLIVLAIFLLGAGAILRLPFLRNAAALPAIGIAIIVSIFVLGGRDKARETIQRLGGDGTSTVQVETIPLAPGAQEIWVSDAQPKWKIPLYANARSGWIHLPAGQPFLIESSGTHTILTWGGKKIPATPGTSTWHGDIQSSVISLMGTGEAIVSIQ